MAVELYYIYSCAGEASKILGLSRTGIHNVLNGWAKTCGKLTWRYYDSK